MPAKSKIVSAQHTGLVTVHQYCPTRPYVELEIPPDAGKVLAVTFEIVSRDQGMCNITTKLDKVSQATANTLLGWADSGSPSFTWFEAELLRPPGRPSVAPLHLNRNTPGDPEFRTAKFAWSSQDIDSSSLGVRAFHQELQGEDVIQLIPRAEFRGWVNIVKEASILVEYQSSGLDDEPVPTGVISPTNCAFYTRKLQDDKFHDTIRILIVEPGAFQDTIHGSFRYESIGESGAGTLDYEALSYFWGPRSNRDHICITNGDSGESSSSTVAFSVSHTVTSAIKSLRCKDKPLRIWVDAICINQADLGEREHQVNLMGSIYSRARAVHIWLGEGECGSGPTLRVIRDAYNLDVDQGCQGGRHCLCEGSPHSGLESLKHYVQGQSKSSWHHLDELFEFHKELFDEEQTARDGGNHWHVWTIWVLLRNPWFMRVWVLQEALRAQRALVHCGTSTVEWRELAQVAEWVCEPQYIMHRRHLHTGLMMPPVWNKLGREKDVPLLDLFLATLDMRATDPRDRLFALLGLSHEIKGLAEIPTALRPDYSKTLGKAMADFTRWCIVKQRSLRVLSMIHCQPSRGWRCTDPVSSTRSSSGTTWALGSEGYSTWVDMNLLSKFSLLNVGGNLEPDPSLVLEDVESDPPVLKLRGRRIGAIEAIGYPPRSMLASFEAVANGDVQLKPSVLSVFVHLLDPCGYHGSWTRPLERNPRHSVNFRDSSMVYYDHLRAHHAYFPPPPAQVLNEHAGNAPSFDLADASHIPSCIHPCYFLATAGQYGLCPWAARVNDIIVTLDGGQVPYLLRPVGLESTVCFEFVGECFVEGLTGNDSDSPVFGSQAETFSIS
ncbi:Uu.00g028600.m01.CDS01 [Anthostomella pinea]|uniref:Uu.00g028600.m01.CDS01 n=1 Tax=Anthostomella pinea TaxID=933095 RepID=A0AAI8V8I8_9PEZI|nr:Uu.00g028600.m01.CDS01 [Anthostomella pinea]